MFMQISFLPIYKLYFILSPSQTSEDPPKEKRKEAHTLLPSPPPSPHLFSGKFLEIQCLQGLRGVGKEKERKMAAGFWYPLLFCFFSSLLLKKKARKSVFIGVKRVWREGGEEEDFIYHRISYNGSRTGIFFTLSVPKNDEKWEFLEGLRERGKKRTLGYEASRSCIDYFILFLAKIIFCQRDDLLLRSHQLCHGKTSFRSWQIIIYPLPKLKKHKKHRKSSSSSSHISIRKSTTSSSEKTVAIPKKSLCPPPNLRLFLLNQSPAAPCLSSSKIVRVPYLRGH